MNSPRVLRNPIVDAQRRAVVGPAAAVSMPATAVLRQPSESVVPAVPASTLGASSAVETGHAEGLRQGLAEAKERIDREIESRWQAQKTQWEQAERRRADEHAQRIDALDALLQTVQKAMPERFLALERQAIELAYEALCRVCGPHAEQEPGTDRAGLLVDLLRQGVQQLRGQAWLGVRLSARDHAALQGHEAGRAFIERHPQLRFSVDASLEPLGVVLETDHGQLDVSLATQLGRLRELWAHAGDDAAQQETP
ncbi:MAG TPA: hypothetical protein VGQ91_07420 [Ideonella sp.]|jgi:flagellar biosynthesis/type III secretory pathway protein FliH|nr:hypothetical protein [Ideonella sp.]